MRLISFAKSRWQEYHFLFEELVKRDFNKKYKRTVLGILWSLLSPLMQLVLMTLVFSQFFGGDMPHFMIYVFSGLLIFNFFSASTTAGMTSLSANADILSRANPPKYIFLLSMNVSNLINFLLTLVIYFILVAIDGIVFHPQFFLLVFPIFFLLLFNIGVGLILSALFVFFRDTQYLYGIFTMLLMWVSAIFYPVDQFSHQIQQLFVLNPVFTYIHYFRLVVLHGTVPSFNLHIIIIFYALVALALGSYIYKKYNYRFIYYM